MINKFWVFRCTNCGQWSVKEIRTELKKKTFNCFYCRKSVTVKQEIKYGLALIYKGPFEHPKQATEMCQALNNLRREKE
jgi:hypothetical protein